jgi:hypothetical protein
MSKKLNRQTGLSPSEVAAGNRDLLRTSIGTLRSFSALDFKRQSKQEGISSYTDSRGAAIPPTTPAIFRPYSPENDVQSPSALKFFPLEKRGKFCAAREELGDCCAPD